MFWRKIDNPIQGNNMSISTKLISYDYESVTCKS